MRRDLIRTDMGPQAANQITTEIGTQFRARVIHRHEAIDVIKSNLKQLMAQDEAPLNIAASGPTVFMICGVNGAGKTTSIAKLTQAIRFARQKSRSRRRRHVPRRRRRTTRHLGAAAGGRGR